MANEAPNSFQSDPGAGFLPEPDEPAGSELLVPVLLLVTSGLFMLVIFAFSHIDDANNVRIATGENASAARAGALIGGLLGWFFFPVIIGLLVSRTVKPPRRLKRFAIVFSLVGILGSLGALALHSPQRSYRSRVDQQVVNHEIVGILKEATGAQPANGDSPVLGKDVSAMTRDFFSQIMRLRKKHDADSEQYAPALGKLYSADSFSSPARMRQSMQAVDGIQKIDLDFASAFGKSVDELKARVQASSLSASDKEGFVRELDNGLGSSEVAATWKDLQKAENQWSRATHAFYGFALEQSSAIKVENGRVRIVGEAVRQEFNSRLRECGDLSNRVMAVGRTMALKQQASMQNIGVTSSDLGLKK